MAKTKLERLQEKATKLEVVFTPETTVEELKVLIDAKIAEIQALEQDNTPHIVDNGVPVEEAIENELPEDSDAKKELRQVFRNYIKQNPEKAEAEKEDLLKQLNSIQ